MRFLGNEYNRNELAGADGFLHIVRAFDNPIVPHPYVDIDPQRDIDILDNQTVTLPASGSGTIFPGGRR